MAERLIMAYVYKWMKHWHWLTIYNRFHMYNIEVVGKSHLVQNVMSI